MSPTLPAEAAVAALEATLQLVACRLGVAWAAVVPVADPVTPLASAGPGPAVALPAVLVPGTQGTLWDGQSQGEGPEPQFVAATRLPGAPAWLLVADPQPRGEPGPADLAALAGCAQACAPAAALLTGGAPPTVPALEAHLDDLRRDLAAARVSLGVHDLAELELAPQDLVREAMTLMGAATGLDWSGLWALDEGEARLIGTWGASGAANADQAVPRVLPREGHAWLWWAASQGVPLQLEHLPPSSLKRAQLGGVRALTTVALGRHGGAQYLFVGLSLAERAPWTARESSLLQTVGRVLAAALARQAQARRLETQQQELQHTLAHAPLILWRTDAAGTFVYGEGQGLGALGLDDSALRGRSVFEVYAGEAAVLAAVRRALGGEPHRAQMRVAGRDYDTSYLPQFGPEGAVSGLLALSYDVTEVQQATRRADALLDLAQELGETENVLQAADRVLGALHGALPLEWLVLWQRDGEVLRPLAMRGEATAEVRRLYAQGVPCAWAERLGVLDDQWSLAHGDALPRALRAAGVGRGALGPVWLDDPTQAVVLGAFCRLPGPWSAREGDLLRVAARSLRAAVRREHHSAELHARAHTDPLTGLGNRRALEAALAAARPAGHRLAVVSLDLNGFKRVNDRHGHAAGDRVLREVAGALRAALAPGEVFRQGGDEFVALLEVEELAAPIRVRRAVDAAQAAVRCLGLGEVGLGWGLATTGRDGPGPDTLLRLSDERLYLHKGRRGREAR